MRISLDRNYMVTVNEDILGYVGETNARSIVYSGLTVNGADTYSMMLDYGDGENYEVDITDGKYDIDGSVLKRVGDISCQILAKCTSGSEYSLIKKSNIFKLKIGESISENPYPIPTYEKALSVLDNINQKMGDLSIVRTSRENYDDMTHNPNTIYFVADTDGKVSMYLGDTAISSSGGGYTPQETAAYSTAAPDVIFAMPVEQESEE